MVACLKRARHFAYVSLGATEASLCKEERWFAEALCHLPIALNRARAAAGRQQTHQCRKAGYQAS